MQALEKINQQIPFGSRILPKHGSTITRTRKQKKRKREFLKNLILGDSFIINNPKFLTEKDIARIAKASKDPNKAFMMAEDDDDFLGGSGFGGISKDLEEGEEDEEEDSY